MNTETWDTNLRVHGWTKPGTYPAACLTRIAALLQRCVATLSQPGTWCQERIALDADGKEVDPESPSACRWCGYGLMRRHGLRSDNLACDALRDMVNMEIPWWNDREDATQDDIRLACEHLAGRLEATVKRGV